MAKPRFGLVAGYVISLAGGVLSLAMYARVLGPSDYGRLAVYLAVVEAMQTVLFQWHRLAAVRFWAQNENRNFTSFLNTYNLVGLGLGAVVLAGIGLYAVTPWSKGESIWLLVIGLGLAKSAALYAQELARAAGESRKYATGGLLLTVGGALGGVLTYQNTHTIESILVVTMMIFLTSSLICAGPICFKARGGLYRTRYVSEMLRYGLPLIPVFLASTALTRLDRPILARFEDASIVGVYAAAMALISNVVSAAFLLIVTPAYPWLLREKMQLSESDFRQVHAEMGVLLATVALGACVAFFGARDIALPLLLGKQIGAAATGLALPLFCVSLIGAYRTHFFDQAFHIFERTRQLMVINVAVVIVATASLYVGALAGGLTGLLWGMGTANAVSMLLSTLASRSFIQLRPLVTGVLWLTAVAALIVLADEKLSQFGIAGESHRTIVGVATTTLACCIFGSIGYLVNAKFLKRMILKSRT